MELPGAPNHSLRVQILSFSSSVTISTPLLIPGPPRQWGALQRRSADPTATALSAMIAALSPPGVKSSYKISSYKMPSREGAPSSERGAAEQLAGPPRDGAREGPAGGGALRGAAGGCGAEGAGEAPRGPRGQRGGDSDSDGPASRRLASSAAQSLCADSLGHSRAVMPPPSQPPRADACSRGPGPGPRCLSSAKSGRQGNPRPALSLLRQKLTSRQGGRPRA